MDFLKILYNANGTLSKQSKIRCAVKSIRNVPTKKTIQIFAWPFPFDKDCNLQEFLSTRGVLSDKNLAVTGYVVDYDTFKSLEKTYKINIINIRWMRNIITILRLKYTPVNFKEIGISHYSKSQPLKWTPVSTSDLFEIEKIKHRREVLYSFETELQNKPWIAKVPAYIGPLLFRDLRLFPNTPIIQRPSNQITGRYADSKGRSYRIIIEKKDLKKLHKILRVTTQNVRKFVPKETWVKPFYETVQNHYSNKEKKEYEIED